MTQPRHGGKRPGSGRHKKPDKAISRSVSMPPAEWVRFDKMRGGLSRGAFLSELMNDQRVGPPTKTSTNKNDV